MQNSMTSYEELIALTRYARWRPEDARRETWPETVNRLMNFWENRLANMTAEEGNADLLSAWDSMRKQVRQAIVDREVMPSMRSLMTAGEALERDEVAGYNPVAGDTRVVTKELGNYPIAELAMSETPNFHVLNVNGEWTEATFRCYGKQKLWNVNLRLNSNSKRTVRATANHRWVLQDGTVKPTSELLDGDRIDFVSAPKPEIDDDYILGVRHGLIYGDGTATRACKRVKGYHIRLCGQNRELLSYFEDYPVCYPPSANGDPVVMMYDDFAATHDLKSLPDFDENPSYLLGFVRGWLAADGTVSKSGQASVCCDRDGFGWLKHHAENIGFVIQRAKKQNSETNYGKRRKESWVLYISRSSITEEDLLCSWKKERFNPLESHFVVTSIEETDDVEDVYCAEVPDTNTFVLEGGLVTGNCAFLAVDNPRAFDEAMYILLCGTGVGFSVEEQYTSQLPPVSDSFAATDTVLTVPDSKIGWATSFRELLSLLWAGRVPSIDYSRIRAAGVPLKTFGGRASGPDPLKDLFNFSVDLFKKAAGRKLRPIECHDLLCKVGEIVVVGGVRRSAMISLSDIGNEQMRVAKSGNWWESAPHRALANNSAVFNGRPDIDTFMREWTSLIESKSGERGMFNRQAAKMICEKIGRDANHDFGTNPCSEIILRPQQFCNLSEVVVRSDDTIEDLVQKVIIATILGTLQATLTNFRYLSKRWKKNCEEERLLGVSLTGFFDRTTGPDCRPLDGQELEHLRDVARETNKHWAKLLGINEAAAITCVKPSGTVSQLVNSASGLHPRHSKFYIRRIRQDMKDPVTKLLIDQGVPGEPERFNPDNTYVFEFPVAAPEDCLTRDDLTAVEQLEVWLTVQKHWCEHKPSVTINVREDEWLEVGDFVWKNFDWMSGVSFLPYDGGTYLQAPYEEIDEEKYKELVDKMPEVNFNELGRYEAEDHTTASQELACVGGKCEI